MKLTSCHWTVALVCICTTASWCTPFAAAKPPAELDSHSTRYDLDYTADDGRAVASDTGSNHRASPAGFNLPPGVTSQQAAMQYWGAQGSRGQPNQFQYQQLPYQQQPYSYQPYQQRPNQFAALPGQYAPQPWQYGQPQGQPRFAPMNYPPRATMAMRNGPPAVPPAVPVNTFKQSSDETASTTTSAGSTTCESCEAGSCQCASDKECSCEKCEGDNCDCCKSHCLPILKIQDCCPLECEEEEVCRVFGDCCCLKERGLAIFGWVDAGIMGNGRLSPDRFNGPTTFPDRRGEGQLNQFYCVLERAIPEDNCGLFIGGRVDYLLGTDYIYNTAAGLDGTSDGNIPRWDINRFYGSDLPQMYVEAAYNDLKVKMGHFYTIIGYEVVPAIGNFFYTHAYTMQYGEPFTHTGVLASRPLNDNWTLYAGVTNGWDTFNTDARANFLGGLTYSQDDWGSLAFAIHTGDESIFGPGVGPWANRTIYSIVWSRTFTSRLSYVLQSDYGNQNLNPIGGQNAEWYGVNQYVFYKLNCCWSAGARIEWFRDDDGYRVTGLRQGNAIAGASFPGNFYECTLGLNWKPNANLIVRPEVRWDWYEGEVNQNPAVAATSPYDAGTRNNQFLYGLDLIYQW